jgi:hypothetical protein
MSSNNVKNASAPSSSSNPSNSTKSFVKSNSLFNLGFEGNSINPSFLNYKKTNTARHITLSNTNINDLKLNSFQVPNSPIDKLNTPRTVTVATTFSFDEANLGIITF